MSNGIILRTWKPCPVCQAHPVGSTTLHPVHDYVLVIKCSRCSRRVQGIGDTFAESFTMAKEAWETTERKPEMVRSNLSITGDTIFADYKPLFKLTSIEDIEIESSNWCDYVNDHVATVTFRGRLSTSKEISVQHVKNELAKRDQGIDRYTMMMEGVENDF